jgi:LmbE family N-acetylglucosaminyl deacetylase
MTRRILLSFAHPDDESFLAAGLACRCAEEGIEVALVTATRGEAGRMGEPPVCTREELGPVRETELRAAAAILGIRDVTLLGLRDRDLAAAPWDQVRAALVAVLRRVRPAVVVTFDPNGSNGHPDHVAISRFTSDAVSAAADPRWFPEAGAAHRVTRLLWSPPSRPWEILCAEDPGARPGADFLVDIRRWSARKLEALAAHRSQHLSVERVFVRPADRERRLAAEVFRQAWGPPLARRPLDDVFAEVG